MGAEKKRKRSDQISGGGPVEKSPAANRSSNRSPAAAAEAEKLQAPSEEEVEEFFAILRRLRDVDKYFGSRGVNVTAEVDGGMSTALKAAVCNGESDESGKEKGDGGRRGEGNGVGNGVGNGILLDLNTVPEAESISD